jgi:hypothetical protein
MDKPRFGIGDRVAFVFDHGFDRGTVVERTYQGTVVEQSPTVAADCWSYRVEVEQEPAQSAIGRRVQEIMRELDITTTIDVLEDGLAAVPVVDQLADLVR